MGAKSQSTQNTLRSNWFFIAAPIILVADATGIYVDRWETPRPLEAALIFDIAVLIPLLYFVCYRAQGKAAIVRAVALACLGIWALGHVVPDANHFLLEKIKYLRYVGILVLTYFEIRLLMFIFESIFNADATQSDSISKITKETGLPKWAAKLVVWEAAFWSKIWKKLQSK